MASKALAKVKQAMAEQKTAFRKRALAMRQKLGIGADPKKAGIFVLGGLMLAAFAPRAAGDKLTRQHRRFLRIGVGVALIYLGRKHPEMMWVGVGCLAAEAFMSGIEYLGPKLGMKDMPEIGALEGRSYPSTPTAEEIERDIYGDVVAVRPEY